MQDTQEQDTTNDVKAIYNDAISKLQCLERCLQRQQGHNPRLLVTILNCIASVYTHKSGRPFTVLLACEKLLLASLRELGDTEKAILFCKTAMYLHRACAEANLEGYQQLVQIYTELTAAGEAYVSSPEL